MKILSIGNSFSQDAHKWLHNLAAINGINVKTANLYIGGCSLQTHWNNFKENNEYYDFEINGNIAERKISIEEALKEDSWDVVTLQQVSQLSGKEETYEPYLSSISKAVKDILPDTKLYFHQTWAYEIDSAHEGFSYYDNSQQKMYESIIDTTRKAAKSIKATIIPTGRIIQGLRKLPEFDYKKGGISLCRDGFHLSYDYGRFAAAATWLHTLMGKTVEVIDFENFDTKLLQKILEVVNE